MDTAQERITTVEDGEGTVNERLSPGGPGPEGQLDTAEERLSGEPAPKAVEAEAETVEEPEKPAAKKASAKKSAKKSSAKKS